jgi:hypothetical protein
MKNQILAIILAASLAPALALAQRSFVRGPGGQHAAPMSPGGRAAAPPAHFGAGNRPGGFIQNGFGRPGVGFGRPPGQFDRGRGFPRGRTIILGAPYYYPFYYSTPFYAPSYYGGYDWPYYGGYAAGQYGNPVVSAPSSSAPNIIIVQPPANSYYQMMLPQAYAYPAPPPQASPEAGAVRPPEQPYTRSIMLALKSRSVYGGSELHREGDNLCFVTDFGEDKCVPMDQVDVPLTKSLNPGVKLDFSLPAKPASPSPK